MFESECITSKQFPTVANSRGLHILNVTHKYIYTYVHIIINKTDFQTIYSCSGHVMRTAGGLNVHKLNHIILYKLR